MKTTSTLKLFTLLSTLTFGACGGDDHDDDHCHDGDECNEVITTLVLNFTNMADSTTTTFMRNDPDGEGGDPPVIDDITLAPGDYDLNVAFENRLETPADDITAEIMEEDDEHQLFFTGNGVEGPNSSASPAVLTHAYDDTDGDGLPIGLGNTVTAAAGSGELIVTLRHLPPVNDAAVKVASLAADVKAGGISALAGIGSTDYTATFTVTVAAP